jgi:uncharacterized circularly permuted ATP-grasp superfamily protein
LSTDAIAAWHGLLDDESAAELSAWLDTRQKERGVAFGNRAVCTVLRPRFFSPAEWRDLALAGEALLRALSRIGAVALDDAQLRAAFHLNDWEEQLIASAPRLPVLLPLSRLDTFIDPATGIARLTEVNGETPAGTGYADFLSELFLAASVMHRFAREWRVRPLPGMPHLLGTLLDTWHAVRGNHNLPTIAIVDWDDVPTESEFRIIREYSRTLGVPFRITTPQALSYSGGVLRDADGTTIDLIYKRVLLHELVDELGLDTPLLRAVVDGNVVMVNGIDGKPLHKKASLAVLTDERHAGLFSEAERDLIARLVPWTRVVEERHTMLDGERIDLLPWMADHRDELVLKPNDDYGGAGIVLGWEVDSGEWQRAIARCLESPYVVQRRIALPSESFPSLVDGRLRFDDRIVDTAPFCWQGSRIDGTLTRISTSTLVNVTAGGGSTVPTFVVEPR